MASDTVLDTMVHPFGMVLTSAPERERRQLAEDIEQYAHRRSTASRDLRNGHPSHAVRDHR
jgi:hypothetical protein